MIAAAFAPIAAGPTLTQNATSEESQMRVLRIYEDAQGNSHLEELVIPGGRFRGREDLPATRVYVREYQGSQVIDWMPTTTRQFVFPIIGGEGTEIEVSNGVRHRVRAGEFFFTEDTKGKGHITRSPAGRRVTLFIRVPDSFDVVAWARGNA